MKVYLVRHGETDWNKENRCQGFVDIPLNKSGIEQARLIGEYYKGIPVDMVYSSPLERAVETARYITDYHKLEMKRHDDLRELNQGELEGLTPQELGSNHSELLKEWFTDPANVIMPGGESLQQLQDRAWPVVNDIFTNNHGAETIVVVSHNLAILAVLCKAINLDLAHFRGLKQSQAAINMLETNRFGGITLALLNSISHLQ